MSDPNLSGYSSDSQVFDKASDPNIGSVTERVFEAHETAKGNAMARRYLKNIVSGVTDAAGFLYMVFPSTPHGFYDTVRNIVIGGIHWNVPVIGVAALIMDAGSAYGIDTAVPVSSIVRTWGVNPPSTAVMPITEVEADDSIVVTPGRTLAVQIYDSTLAGLSYTAVVRFWRSPVNVAGLPGILASGPPAAPWRP